MAGPAAAESPPVAHPSSHPGSPQVDARDYGVAAHILRDLGITSVALMTANTAKLNCLKAHGIKVTEQLPPLPAAPGNGAAAAVVAAAAAPDGSSKKGPRNSRNGAEPHFV